MVKLIITDTTKASNTHAVPVPRGVDAMDLAKAVVSRFTILQLKTIKMYIADDNVNLNRIDHHKYIPDDALRDGEGGSFEEVPIDQLAEEHNPETLAKKKKQVEMDLRIKNIERKESVRDPIEQARQNLKDKGVII
jgi:hypothetical protein